MSQKLWALRMMKNLETMLYEKWEYLSQGTNKNESGGTLLPSLCEGQSRGRRSNPYSV